MPEASGNGRNGTFMKILVGVNVAIMGAGIIGGVKLNREVGVLQVGSGLEKRVESLEIVTRSIDADRNKRTEILRELREYLDYLRAELGDTRRRLERLESRR